MVKAIFLDRDDTIIINKPYMHRPEDIEYYPWTEEALTLLRKLKFSLYLVTNQSGIGRGYYQESDMQKVHHQINEDLESWGLEPFNGIAFCPHAPNDSCSCRKPNPEMINQILSTDNFDLNQCFMVGDKVIDAQAGINAGISGILLGSDPQYTCFENLLFFANSLMS